MILLGGVGPEEEAYKQRDLQAHTVALVMVELSGALGDIADSGGTAGARCSPFGSARAK